MGCGKGCWNCGNLTLDLFCPIPQCNYNIGEEFKCKDKTELYNKGIGSGPCTHWRPAPHNKVATAKRFGKLIGGAPVQ